jgi:hypothetical protein
MASFHDLLSKAQSSVAAIDASIPQRLDDWAKHQMAGKQPPSSAEMEVGKQHRLDAVARAKAQVDQAGK